MLSRAPRSRPEQQERSDVAHLGTVSTRGPGGRSGDLPPVTQDDSLTRAQREAVQAQYGDRSIDAVRTLGPQRGDGPRLVRLDEGTLVTVFSGGRGDKVRVREVKPRRGRNRPARDMRSRGPDST
jgi:hypothetical protein